MLNQEAKRTLLVALVLCLLCSVVVSVAAVALKPLQMQNRLLDRNKNILMAAGLFKPEFTRADINREFSRFAIDVIDLKTGESLSEHELSSLGIADVQRYDAIKAAKKPSLSRKLIDDPAGIISQEKYGKVYLLKDAGRLSLIVLPVRGYGLWGTLYGFLVVDGTGNTIKGLSFYSHKETPGLGAKVDLPDWKAQWQGKPLYNDQGDVAIVVGRKNGDSNSKGFVDGLSGATLTTSGVHRLIHFWLGKEGYLPYLNRIKRMYAATDSVGVN